MPSARVARDRSSVKEEAARAPAGPSKLARRRYNQVMRRHIPVWTALVTTLAGCARQANPPGALDAHRPLVHLDERGTVATPATKPTTRARGWERETYEEGYFVLDNVPLDEALAILAVQARRSWSYVELRPDWQAIEDAGVSRHVPVHLRIWSPTVRKALGALLEQVSTPEAPLDFDWYGTEVINVTTRARILKDCGLVREYDIRGLMKYAVDDVAPAEKDAAPRGGLGLAKPMTAQERRDAIVGLIKETVAPKSWEQAGDCWIRANGNVLTVRQTMENHKAVEALMGQLYETVASDPLRMRVRPTTQPARR